MKHLDSKMSVDARQQMLMSRALELTRRLQVLQEQILAGPAAPPEANAERAQKPSQRTV